MIISTHENLFETDNHDLVFTNNNNDICGYGLYDTMNDDGNILKLSWNLDINFHDEDIVSDAKFLKHTISGNLISTEMKTCWTIFMNQVRNYTNGEISFHSF